MKYIFIIVGVILLISACVMFAKNKKADEKITTAALGGSFELVPGQSVEIGTLKLTYRFLHFPPDSYKGDKTEYISAQMDAEERADQLNFAMNGKRNSQKFHDYLIELLSGADKKITLKVTFSPNTVKISEEQAVAIALEVAKKRKIPDPVAYFRTLKDGVWEISTDSSSQTDTSLYVKINASTGEVVDVKIGGWA